MLDQILTDAIPLRDSVILSDPWDWGFVAKIYRLDATEYQKAEDEINPALKVNANARRAFRTAMASATGARRGKGGVLVGKTGDGLDAAIDEIKAEAMTIDDQIPAIADHLVEFKTVPDSAVKLWGLQEGRPMELGLLSHAPLGPNGNELMMPAAFRGEGEERKAIWKVDEARDTDAVVPYGGSGWGYKPTLNRMLAAWVRDVTQSEEYFEDTGEGPTISEAIETVRPTSNGSDSSSGAGDSSIGAP